MSIKGLMLERDSVLTGSMEFRVDPIEVFPEVEKLLYEVSWEFARKYPMTFEECRSIAYASFLKACVDYTPDRKMKFATWARYWAWCKLKDHVMKHSGERISFTDEIGEDELTSKPDIDLPSPAMELLREMGQDAKTIASLFFEEGDELCYTIPQLVKRVKKYLCKEHKWTPQRFESTMEEMRTTFQEQWAKAA
jgi:hypothetical protein